MKKLTLTLLGATALVGGLATASLAQSDAAGRHGGHAMRLFERFDSNGDGKIDRTEADAFRDARFAEADENGDGQVTREELQALYARMAEQQTAERFARLDADGDGSISQQEFMAAEQQRRQARMGGERGERHLARHFDRMDANDDGALDAEELGARGQRLFDRLDSDDDGVVTQEEAQQAMAKHRGHHRRGWN